MLGVDGDDFSATTPDQEDPVQPFRQDLEELHVVLVPLPTFWGAWHIQQDQLGILGLVENYAVELHSSMHPPDVGLVPGRRMVEWAQWA